MEGERVDRNLEQNSVKNARSRRNLRKRDPYRGRYRIALSLAIFFFACTLFLGGLTLKLYREVQKGKETGPEIKITEAAEDMSETGKSEYGTSAGALSETALMRETELEAGTEADTENESESTAEADGESA